MSSGTVVGSIEGEVGYITINNPRKRNALSLEMWTAIPQLVDTFVRTTSVKVLCLTGSGDSAFASGMDISELRRALDGPDGVAEVTTSVEVAQRALIKSVKPVVAVINGLCVGGGLELAIACDVRIACESASFAAAPAKLGLVYSMTTTRALTQLVGPGTAKDLLFTGRNVSSIEAHDMGLVQRLVADCDLREGAKAYFRVLCLRSQFSIQGAKKAVAIAADAGTESEDDFEQLRTQAFSGPDFVEGLHAFQEKRPPKFTWQAP